MSEVKETKKTNKEPTYSKDQILKAEKYKFKKDVLNVILKDGAEYTIKEVDSAIDMFMKREVK